MLINNCNPPFELDLDQFKKRFPAGSFYTFTATAFDFEPGDVSAVSFVIPMQDGPEPPIFEVLVVEPEDGTAEAEYSFVTSEGWTNHEFVWCANSDDVEDGRFRTVQEAIDAARAAALAHAANNPAVPEIWKAYQKGGQKGVDRYVNEVAELEKMFQQ